MPRKRTVSEVPNEAEESPEAAPEISKKEPTVKVRTFEKYSNWAIGNGINWRAGSVHEVTIPIYWQLRSDNPNGFEKVEE